MFLTKIFISEIHDIYYCILPSIFNETILIFYFNSMIDIYASTNDLLNARKKKNIYMLTRRIFILKMKKVIYTFHPLTVKKYRLLSICIIDSYRFIYINLQTRTVIQFNLFSVVFTVPVFELGQVSHPSIDQSRRCLTWFIGCELMLPRDIVVCRQGVN